MSCLMSSDGRGNLLLAKQVGGQIGSQHGDSHRHDEQEDEHRGGEIEGHLHVVKQSVLHRQSQGHRDAC